MISESYKSDPPSTIILQRQSITQFPNGQKCALYYADSIKQYIIIPYEKAIWTPMKEDIYDILVTLKDSEEINTITFNDNSELNIDRDCILPILELYESSEIEEQYLIKHIISESSSNYLKILDYALKQKDQQ